MEKLETELKELIVSRYGSVNRFCTDAGIPWGTLDSILKRGICNANINNVLKITHALHIDTDALADGEIKRAGDALFSLSEEEEGVLTAFRNLSEGQKDLVCQMLGVKRKDAAVLDA